MDRKKKRSFSIGVWVSILLFLLVVLTFPRWISIFYPQPHRDIVYETAYDNEVDPHLVFAIIRAESKYQPAAQSQAGARGLMQIMPETAAWIAEQKGISDFKAEQLNEPALNISFGCWYLNSLDREFKGELPLVIAAYNAGRGKVKEWRTQGIWDGDAEKIDEIPFAETRKYVKMVLKNYEAYRAIYQ